MACRQKIKGKDQLYMRDTKQMLIYIAKRLVLMLFTFIIILTLCFFLIRLLPDNAAVAAPGQDPEVYYMYQAALGRYVKDPTVPEGYSKVNIFIQYLNFWKNLFAPGHFTDSAGNVVEISRFGYSWIVKPLYSPVEILAEGLPPTIIINLYTMLISIPIGLGLGIFMALKKNKWQDHLLSVLIMVFISVPSFVYALLLQISVYATGMNDVIPPIMSGNIADIYGNINWFSWKTTSAMILPVVAMSLGTIAGFARYTRAELTEVLTSDFMLLARTKGLTRAQATIRHALRNSLVPIFPMILGQFLSILSGSLVIEQIFGVPGVGALFLNSIVSAKGADFDVFLFVSMFYTLIGLVGGLIVDLSYGFVDPRIRMGGGK